MRWWPRARLGLALGGGAARGFAHLGVLEVLEEAGIEVAAVSGTSIGSIVGGVWASTGRADSVRRALADFLSDEGFRTLELSFLHRDKSEEPSLRRSFARALKKGLFYGRTALKESYIPAEIYRGHFVRLLPDVDIETLPRGFAAMATDLLSGRAVVFRQGSVRDAAMASGAIPGVMPPVPREGMLLADGVISDRVPVRALLAMDVDAILAVDVAGDFIRERSELRRGTSIHARAQQCVEHGLREIRGGLADLLVRPDLSRVNPLDFANALPAVQRGREAMSAALPRLEHVLRRARAGRVFGRTRPLKVARMAREGWFGPQPLEIERPLRVGSAATLQPEEEEGAERRVPGPPART